MSTLDRMQAEAGKLLRDLPDVATDPRLLLGLLGAVLLVAGKRFYPLAIVSPGVAAGIMLGLHLTEGQDTVMRAVVVAALAIVAAFVLHSAERLAVAAAGAFVAVGATQAIGPRFVSGELPWYVLVAAGIVGLFLFPRVYQRLLVVITPAIGAFCIAWASGQEQNLLLIIGLTLAGTVLQLVLWSRGD